VIVISSYVFFVNSLLLILHTFLFIMWNFEYLLQLASSTFRVCCLKFMVYDSVIACNKLWTYVLVVHVMVQHWTTIRKVAETSRRGRPSLDARISERQRNILLVSQCCQSLMFVVYFFNFCFWLWMCCWVWHLSLSPCSVVWYQHKH